MAAKLALCKSELAVLVHDSVNAVATIGNYRDDGDVDSNVFSATERDRLTENEHNNKRKAELAAYDRNKRIEEAVKYRVDLRLASEMADYVENDFPENDTTEYEVDSRSEPPPFHVPESPHFHVSESQYYHVVEDQVEPEPVDPFPNVADQVRAEARRLQLRAQEITVRRKALLAEKERMNIIDIKCQGNLIFRALHITPTKFFDCTI